MRLLSGAHLPGLRLSRSEDPEPIILPAAWSLGEAGATVALYQRHADGGPLNAVELKWAELERPSILRGLDRLHLDRTMVLLRMPADLSPAEGLAAALRLRAWPHLILTEGRPAGSSVVGLNRMAAEVWAWLEEEHNQERRRWDLGADLAPLDPYRAAFDVPSDLVALVARYQEGLLDGIEPPDAAISATRSIVQAKVDAATSGVALRVARALAGERPAAGLRWLVDRGLWHDALDLPARWAAALAHPEVARGVTVRGAAQEWIQRIGNSAEVSLQAEALDRAEAALEGGNLELADVTLRSLAADPVRLLPAATLDPKLQTRFDVLGAWLQVAVGSPIEARTRPDWLADEAAERAAVAAWARWAVASDERARLWVVDGIQIGAYANPDWVLGRLGRALDRLSGEARAVAAREWFALFVDFGKKVGDEEEARRVVTLAEDGTLGPEVIRLLVDRVDARPRRAFDSALLTDVGRAFGSTLDLVRLRDLSVERTTTTQLLRHEAASLAAGTTEPRRSLHLLRQRGGSHDARAAVRRAAARAFRDPAARAETDFTALREAWVTTRAGVEEWEQLRRECKRVAAFDPDDEILRRSAERG